MKRMLIGVCALCIVACHKPQAAHRQVVLEQMNASEVCAIPDTSNTFLAKVHGQIWYVETDDNSGYVPPRIKAKTLIFNGPPE